MRALGRLAFLAAIVGALAGTLRYLVKRRTEADWEVADEPLMRVDPAPAERPPAVAEPRAVIGSPPPAPAVRGAGPSVIGEETTDSPPSAPAPLASADVEAEFAAMLAEDRLLEAIEETPRAQSVTRTEHDASSGQPEPLVERDGAPMPEPAPPVIHEHPQPEPLLEPDETDLPPVAASPAPAAAPPPEGEQGARAAESYLEEGNVYFNVGQYGLAIERYTRAIEIDPALTAGYYNRANARSRAGQADGALADYDQALALQPADTDALNNRGMLHLYRADYEAAITDFTAALGHAPGDTTVLVNRGLAALQGGDPEAALKDFDQAATLDARDAAAHYGAAQASAVLGNREAALRRLERALEIEPGYAQEAAGDAKLAMLQGDADFMRLLRDSGRR